MPTFKTAAAPGFTVLLFVIGWITTDAWVSKSLDRCWKRNEFLAVAIASCCGTSFSKVTNAAETVGKDPNCNDSSCLGVWDGILADCPHTTAIFGAGCVSSQDDTPGLFAEPWDYSDNPINQSLDYSKQMQLLRPTVEQVCARRGDQCQVVLQDDRYLRMSIVDSKSGEQSIAEFYFTPNDTTVQFRIGSVKASNVVLQASSLRNIERSELFRKEMRYEKIPVLRNRKRSLIFFESEMDTFGPGSASLGPPEDMKSGEIDNGRLSETVDPKLKIDMIQQFPFPSTT
ncbi:hypothetical protein IV203_036182 [Nitzschia inconspicua]|uniref:Uncharacterized protein n=1 Tax=Nitzschia inconspicua TaxID=303405 RepID=A0A9K3LFH9_9STRA|nr:hypothetical protein IV203_036182 [Nitzschia inconspicua]